MKPLTCWMRQRHAELERELRDNDVRGMCIIEAAVRSPSIADCMSHWEGRCLKAEAENARLRGMLRDVEYSTYDDVLMVSRCAWCDATRREGHRGNCEWKAALERKA